MVLGTTSDVEVWECAAATDGPLGDFCCYPRASLLPAIFSCACITGSITLVPQIKTLTCVPQRAQQAAYRRAQTANAARGLCAPRETARRGKWNLSSLGVSGELRERAHPGRRLQREQRRTGVRARHSPDQPQVGARSGTTFRCIPDPGAHLPLPTSTRATIGVLNLTLKIPWSLSGSSSVSPRAKQPRARPILAYFSVPGP